ncbi:MAG: hypothetical protein JJ858_14170 [Rhizobiaceae bacterium]|nr:hypothetical protein [Rhizobiaceae bacterium]
MKLLKSLALSTALIAGSTTAGLSADAKVTISDLTWTGAKAIGFVIQEIITGPMGMEAEIVEGMSDGSIIAAGMDKGDGSIDVYTDFWMPSRAGLWDKYIDGAATVAVNTPYEGTQRIYVPSYMTDKLSSIEDMKKPEVALLFDSDGNGKGEYWAGEIGWKSTKQWKVKFKSYGLDELWEAADITEAAFKGQLKAAYAKGEPALFYRWTPEAMFAEYDLSAVEEPARTEGCEKVDLEAEDWLEVSTFSCASSVASVYVAYSKTLETRNPAVAKMLSNIKLDPSAINAWILSINGDGLDPRDVAQEWVADNMDTVNAWING